MFILNLLQNGHDWEKVNQVGKESLRGIYDEFSYTDEINDVK